MRKRDETKAATIRKKAIEMIAKHGIDSFSMQKLARTAGISPATIYIHFKDKDALILNLFMEENSRMLEAMLHNFEGEMSFEEGLKMQWKNRAAYALKYPLQVAFLEQLRHSPLYEKVFPVQGEAFRQAMKTFVMRAIRNKELIELPFEVFWSIAYAPLYQLIKYHQQGKSYHNKKFVLEDKLMSQALSLVLKALRP